ncbi:LysR family transcriptional regulator [Paucibacter sp. DJ2R-2]|uniref:LysR family transcriptional regulator n=1 Tax=Paucibacter sp. DJ2R-2 TaxID=2893558 RepID=UPI0021E476BC|nr:LysR family transcriptional regulator [Paucibacter sp. DJ2R-2]MCV2421658.1 LysR family transcriptional regulator [Paucibacter sp. DJ4R-1]MCV2438363.1 LysR family transcriptional regulator [Paucibacter sp. DJ2R-2]
MDRLLAMQTFVRVVETGSFSAVAREQSSTQSAVSKQVAALERHLGAKLLTRTTRNLSLTDDGERYFEDVRRLVAEVLETEEQLRRGEQQLSGWLRVAASVGFGTRVLRPHVHSFLAAHPGVKIDLKLNDGFIDLVEHGIDMAVRIGNLADSTLVARRIGSIRRAVVASRAYVQAATVERPMPLIPEDLKRHPCIVYTELRNRNLWDFSTPDGSTVSVRVEGPLQTNTAEIVRAAVLDSVGIAYSPTWLFQDLIDSGDVQVLLQGWQPSPLPLHLVSPPERRRAAKVRAFAEHLANALIDCPACQ